MNGAVNRIVVPMDLSAPARAGLEKAAELARFHHARISLVHVIEHQSGVGDPALHEPWNEDDERVRRIDAQLRELAREVLGEEIPYQVVILRAESVEKAVIDHARAMDAELVVLGTHELDSIKHPMQHRLADAISRGADCRVVLAREGRRHSSLP